jgi:tRNA acetyltransferase TAN1
LHGFIPSRTDDAVGEEQGSVGDIESSITNELESIRQNNTNKRPQFFTPIKLNVDCLIFVKTRDPIDPVGFVHRICQDAKLCGDPRKMKSRYVNRLTPVSLIGEASEHGVVEVAKRVLAPYFDLSGKTAESEPAREEAEQSSPLARVTTAKEQSKFPGDPTHATRQDHDSGAYSVSRVTPCGSTAV